MEYNDALKLKELWGEKQCDHPGFEKLYYAGAFLVNYTCIRCGTDFTIAQKLEIDEKRNKKSGLHGTESNNTIINN